jgi:hypothetical protein
MDDLQLDALAEGALDVIAEVSGKAEQKMRDMGSASVDGLASGKNTLTGASGGVLVISSLRGLQIRQICQIIG